MSPRLRSFILLAASVWLAFAAGSAFGEQPKAPDGPAPRTADGKPDLSGVWDLPYVPDMSKSGQNHTGVAELPLTEWGQSQWKNYNPAEGDYTGACLPFGLVRSINSPMPMQIVQNNKYISMNFEVDNWFLIVPIDGRKHRDDVPRWAGDSVGHWEGDTLVIDTVNFNGRTRLDTIGHPHSDQLHVIQRWTRTDLRHIADEITIDDPKAYSKPWKNTRIFTLRPDWEIMEYSCEENNKSLWEGRIKVPKY